MGKRRPYPPSGPAWSLDDILRARDEIASAHRDADTADDLEWVILAWKDWWLDLETVVPPAEWCGILSRPRAGVPT